MTYSKQTTNIVIENWDKQKVKLKQKLATPKYKAISYTESEREEMLEILQIQLGIRKEELIAIINGSTVDSEPIMGLT